jgi:hypothetical protein
VGQRQVAYQDLTALSHADRSNGFFRNLHELSINFFAQNC